MNFKPRSFLLRSEVQLNALQSLLPNLPLSETEPLEIVIREPVKKRGLDQNGYYWLRIGEIAEQAWVKG
ncbi:MAG: recombination protein NinB, partial [Thiobacillaceae bacterium]